MDNLCRNGNKAEKILKLIIWVLFILYIITCFKVMLFKYTSLIDIFHGRVSRIQSLNLIPFKTIWNFYEIARNQGAYLWAFSNIFGNILIVIPLGYCIPLLIKKFESSKKVFLITLVFSLFIEILQYFSHMGAADIDDLICNTIGGILGYYIFKLIQRFIVKRKALYIVTIVGAFTVFISGFLIAKEHFVAY